MLLKDLVSKIVVDIDNPSEFASDVIRDCKQAQTIQSNWGQTTKKVVGEKPTNHKQRIIEMTYVMTRQAYNSLKNCEFLQKKPKARYLTEQQIIDTLNSECNPPAPITSYILAG